MREACGNCRFMRDGLCLRQPPQIVPEVWRGTDASIAHATWPEVDELDWCGEWKPAQ